LPLLIHLVGPHEDGVQLALPLLISNNPTEASLSQFLFTAWYIWKARNDNRFQRQHWSSFQVHRTTEAHMQTHLKAMEEISHPQQQPLQPPNTETYHTPHTNSVNAFQPSIPTPGTSSLQPMTITHPTSTSPSLSGIRCYVDASM
jgi:hypothetical protein